jgi:hypothetical protein
MKGKEGLRIFETLTACLVYLHSGDKWKTRRRQSRDIGIRSIPQAGDRVGERLGLNMLLELEKEWW